MLNIDSEIAWSTLKLDFRTGSSHASSFLKGFGYSDTDLFYLTGNSFFSVIRNCENALIFVTITVL